MRNPTYLGGQQWKRGDEFLPFHPQASHISPDYRDGWNRCFRMAASVFLGPPRAWEREDGTDVMRDDDKVSWIDSGNRDKVELYTVALYAKKDPEDVPGTWVTREEQK